MAVYICILVAKVAKVVVEDTKDTQEVRVEEALEEVKVEVEQEEDRDMSDMLVYRN